MASLAAKARRRAEAHDELKRLSGLLAKKLGIDPPEVVSNTVDPELGQIQQVESINKLLKDVLDFGGLEPEEEVLGTMTKNELIQKANEQGVEVSKTAKKAELIEAVKGKK